MHILHNISGLFSINAMQRNKATLGKSIERLSSGLRIRNAHDDAAGSFMVEKMTSQVRGTDQAIENSLDGISMVQTAEGALNESHSVLQRMRELSVQASNDTLTQQDRASIQSEMDELMDNLSSISTNTTFNRKPLLDGSASCLWSTDSLDTNVAVHNSKIESNRDVEGNYKVEIDVVSKGRAQSMKSNIFPICKDGKELTLEDIPQFYDNGHFMLDTPRSIYIEQGDEGPIKVTFYKGDTVEKITSKLNDAIAFGLGQDRYVDDANIVDFANISSGVKGTSESIRKEENLAIPVKRIDEVLKKNIVESHSSGAVAFSAITEGSTNVKIHINDIGLNDTIQIFTRDGTHISGTSYPDPGMPMPALTKENGFLPGATYKATGPLLNPAFNDTPPYNQITYKGATIGYSGDGNYPPTPNVNENFTIDKAPEDLLLFVTGNGAFSIDATWDNIVDNGNSDYSLSAPVLLHSSIAGRAGEFAISGDDDILKALGFATVEKSAETQRKISIKNAHTGEYTLKSEVISGGTLKDGIPPSIDLSFDDMAGLNAEWNDYEKHFTSSAYKYTTTVHIANHTTKLQIGANEGEDMALLFDDMTPEGLGLTPPRLSVVSRALSNEALSRIDSAIERVSKERVKMGTYKNKLEYTISYSMNLEQNTQESRSRIKDLDMAKEMMNFSSLSILNEANSSLLSHIKKDSEAVLSLFSQQ